MFDLDGTGDLALIDVVFAEELFAIFSTFSSETIVFEGFAGAVAGSAGLGLGESVL